MPTWTAFSGARPTKVPGELTAGRDVIVIMLQVCIGRWYGPVSDEQRMYAVSAVT